MRLFSFIFVLCLTANFTYAQVDISDARAETEGTVVTVEGVVTNGFELGIIRYIQDDSGAIAVYPGNGSVGDFPNDVSRGDRIQVTGPLKSFNGLLEIDPVQDYTVISQGNALPDPMVVMPGQINEENEARLLKVEGVTFENGGSVFTVGNFSFSNADGESEIYVRSGHPLLGTTVPLATVDLTGISSEFNGLYQLLLRDANDIEIADDFYITSAVTQSDINTTGFTLSWETNADGVGGVRYGTTPDMDQNVNGSASVMGQHSVQLTGLEPNTFYYCQAYATGSMGMAESNRGFYTTGSTSNGWVQVYFNHDVNGNLSTGQFPVNTTPAAMEGAIIERIQNAQNTIDFSMYNCNRPTIIQALTDAYNNGVQVRYITDDETANLALMDPVPPFPILKGNGGSPLMHNKFVVIDADSETDSWVLSGSVNMTDQNIATDYNNLVVIQDITLAKAYTIEFEEMWGTDGPNPGVFSVAFGEDKVDNTPHIFNVAGKTIESYFSPSDNTATEIAKAIRNAEEEVSFALLTFTYNDLGDAIVDVHDSGLIVRGIIDNITDTGSEYEYLINNGVDVMQDGSSKQTHHKYAIIDPQSSVSQPKVITGSHNWSNGANSRNDENTLIFHDSDIANIFYQEFEARWCEATTGVNCTTSIIEQEIDGLEWHIAPNPVHEDAIMTLRSKSVGSFRVLIYDELGRLHQSHVLPHVDATKTQYPLNFNGLVAGIYTVVIENDLGRESQRIIKQ